MSVNDLPKLIKEYGKDITFMGGIDNGKVDRFDWNQEMIEEVKAKADEVYFEGRNIEIILMIIFLIFKFQSIKLCFHPIIHMIFQ